MNWDLQEIVAALIVAAAVLFLARVGWSRLARRGGCSGCGNCSCSAERESTAQPQVLEAKLLSLPTAQNSDALPGKNGVQSTVERPA